MGKLTVIDNCNAIVKATGVEQRQSYKRVSKQLLRDTYNRKHYKERNLDAEQP